MQAGADDPEVLNHFTVALYPFFHAAVGEQAAPRLEALEGRWRPWWCRLSDGELAEALEGTFFFLPYVRSLLYLATTALRDEPAGDRYAGWVERVRRLTGQGLGALLRELPPNPVLRLTLPGPALAALADFTVTWPGAGPGHGGLPARLDWADAVLFPSGLGFLLLRARLASGPPRL